MLLNRLRSISILMAVLAITLSAGCQPSDENKLVVGEERNTVSRNTVDALDRQTASSRHDRVSDVQYDLEVDLHGGDDSFSGQVTIRFALTNSQSDLSVDFGGGTVQQLVINGSPVKVEYNGSFLVFPAAAMLEGANTASVEFEHAYDEDGTGLHRFVDPEDGLTYLYTYLWPYYANRMFPSFDQPNLKAKISLAVRAPEDWAVVSTATGKAEPAEEGSRLWHFGTTPKISTYAFSLHAGPYKVWTDDADGVPIRLMARQSLAPFVAVDEWLEVTKQGLEYYGRYFDIPYAFSKYDQLIVPDFNIGAMENIGAVTFAERFVQRQQSSRTERESRVSVILHEMAHMWFGNLVTHDWWNGLWLNESFATQMSVLAMAETTEFTDIWHGFFTNAKNTAYARDSRVTTHPIELPVNSTADFFTVFDAITYQKGSSVLKQLAHYVGAENYRLGVSAYLKEHSYGTTELDDFIGHQGKSSGIDLDGWSREWLYQPGFNTLKVSTECMDGDLQSFTVSQTAPDQYPQLRHHQLDVALYSIDDNGVLLPGEIFPLEVKGKDTRVEVPEGQPCPAIINPNHNDWTYTRIELDDRTIGALGEHLSSIPEPLTRSIFLASLMGRAMDGDMPLVDFVGHAKRLADEEKNIRVQQQISASVITTIELMQRLRPETTDVLTMLLPELEEWSLQHAANAATSDLKRNWFNTFTGIVSSESGLATVRALLDGTDEIAGLPISTDVRWVLLMILSRHDGTDIDVRLAAESAADISDFGAKSALTASAARPDIAAKAKWLAELRNPETLTGLARQRAVMAGIFPPTQTALQLELLGQVLEALPDLSETSDPYFMQSYASVLLTPMCVPQSASMMQKALDDYGDQLNSTALRFLREALQGDRECLALRRAQ